MHWNKKETLLLEVRTALNKVYLTKELIPMRSRFFIIAIAMCNALSLYGEVTETPTPLDTALSTFETKYHVQVLYQYTPDSFFPKSWRNPSLELTASPIHEQDAEILIPALEQFLSAHPPSVIKDNLEHIYLLGKLSFQGREYGGTHTAKDMYLVWDRSRKYTPEFVLERCHSEFSSILRDHHPFPSDQWQQINPTGFSYTGTGFEMLGSGSIYNSNDLDQRNGFLLKYSKSSMENDFNMISSWLFTRPGDLAALGMKYERIQQKCALAEAFYRSISDQYAFHQAIPVPSL